MSFTPRYSARWSSPEPGGSYVPLGALWASRAAAAGVIIRYDRAIAGLPAVVGDVELPP